MNAMNGLETPCKTPVATLRNRPLGARLLLLVMGLYMLTLAALFAGSAYLTREHMIRDRVTKLQAVVDVTETMAKLLEADVTAQRLTRAQAIDRFPSAHLCDAI